MTNWRPEDVGEYRDVQTIYNYAHSALTKSPQKRLERLWRCSRDNARTPVQWSGEKNAGFTTGDSTWISVNPNYTRINVAAQEEDPDSVLNFYRDLISVRHGRPVIIHGDTRWIEEESDQHMSYIRSFGECRLASLNNFTDGSVEVSLPAELDAAHAQILLSNTGRTSAAGNRIRLGPWECLTVEWN